MCISPKNSCTDRQADPKIQEVGNEIVDLYQKSPERASKQLREYIVNNFVSTCETELDTDLVTICEVPREEFCSKNKAEVLKLTATGTAFCQVPSHECIN